MRIVIETIPHATHRYPTAGDYWDEPDGTIQIRVSDLADERHVVLVAVHELVEAYLCRKRGIREQDITAFDCAHLAANDPWVDDPGHCPQAPYHREHVFAECIERLLAFELGVNWQEYEAALMALE